MSRDEPTRVGLLSIILVVSNPKILARLGSLVARLVSTVLANPTPIPTSANASPIQVFIITRTIIIF